VQTLRESTTQRKSVAIVTLYQAGEDIYKLFDKVLVLHEGHQIYFGPTKTARSYFTDLGLNARTWSSTPDFLTSVTTPKGRLLRPGYKDQVPNTAEDYATQWGTSGARSRLRQQIRDYNAKHRLVTSGVLEQHSDNPKILPYAISLWKQISLCAMRGVLRTKNDLNAPISALVGNLVISIILGSMFYNQNEDTGSFTGRGVLLFITVFLNTSLAGFEVRPSLDFSL
jgi:ATP-binding cassette subfamily G (WHITE) protein 2 (PDR)